MTDILITTSECCLNTKNAGHKRKIFSRISYKLNFDMLQNLLLSILDVKILKVELFYVYFI